MKHMKKTPPSNGNGAPNLFYRRPTDNKGGPCHAADCDWHSACLLQLQRKQKTKDGQEVKHRDQLGCTITCRYCGKRRHYEDECHIKRSESEALKKAEEERRKNAGMGGKPEGGGCTPGASPGTGNPGGGQRNSAPSTVGGGAPGCNHKSEQPGDKRTVPSSPSAGGTDKACENGKKGCLNWRSKCLQVAGVEVKSPEEE